mmetsp:Transcript_9930/g.18119  ORF Transcript_9930/g.18119 Transcript_9930/m.18119 type:complete len:359 (+) Transcript_9930:167-1243(+)|eukprot:CAMPEP_0196130174 /NCGR_PEP_ID=MMETSP0910-20130528/640_1 /TAXON_ID=49265 /ORGANISM="Thalassiosira rotula, Strain GSO102" /LENGTH=358 /DNA_ID=CAMNT_0041389427 /DNA_START=125 /DNA_END=1201 /DNA_ORIENTATION=+
MAFNKMFVMLPVMLAARNLDGDDPNVIFMLRCVYGVMQTLSMLLVIFIYFKATAAAKESGNAIKIYVSPPPQPFADPNAKQQYQEKILSEHLTTTARGLVGSTLFGICMTVGLHIWKGMVVGLAIQSVMAPFNLFENSLVSAVFLKGGFVDLKEKKIFAEKVRDELTDADEVVDGEGNVVKLTKEIVGSKKVNNNKGSAKKETKSLEDVLLDTWDLGADADIKPLMGMLTKKNINFATSDNGWTPIMIMSGLGAKSAPGAMRQMKALGANPAKLDKEGWNALHWSAFHGSADAAKVLLAKDDFDGIAMGLHEVVDKEGKDAVTHAKDEGNDDVAKVIEEAVPSDLGDGTAGEGLRKRK